MPKILGIETATDACSAALWLDGQITGRFEIAPRRHSELILPMVDSLLSEANAQLKDLDAIAFGAGPGGFMGVRIAAAIAQGLAFGVDLPLLPVSTMRIIAQVAYRQHAAEKVIAGWDARMNAIYWGAYQLDSNELMQPVAKDALNDPGEITAPEGEGWSTAGNAWQAYEGQLNPEFKDAIAQACDDVYPRSAALVELAQADLAVDNQISVFDVEPVYLRDQVVRT